MMLGERFFYVYLCVEHYRPDVPNLLSALLADNIKLDIVLFNIHSLVFNFRATRRIMSMRISHFNENLFQTLRPLGRCFDVQELTFFLEATYKFGKSFV